MGEPGRCMKCGTDIILDGSHKCPSVFALVVIALVDACGVVFGASLRAMGHAIVWWLVWHYLIWVDLAAAIGAGIRTAGGG